MNYPIEESIIFPSNSNWETLAGYDCFVLVHRGVLADSYRAQKAGRYFLLKTPRDSSTVALNSLKREYEVSIGLDHPNITSAFTFEEIKPLGPCIVMEYVDGYNLYDFLKTNPSSKVRKKIFAQLLSAVGYLHCRNIIHNDLKPENIIITRQDNNLKLIDFGLSDDQAHYLAKTPGCTPSFASPELLAEEGNLDARSDIYSIGKLLKLIFPSRYAWVAAKCTRKDKEKRFRSTEDISRALSFRPLFTKTLAGVVLVGCAAAALLYDKTEIQRQQSELDRQKSIIEEYETGQALLLENQAQQRSLYEAGKASLDSLYTVYAGVVKTQHDRDRVEEEIVCFIKEYYAIRDQYVKLFDDDSAWDEFYAFTIRYYYELCGKLRNQSE